MNIKTLMGISSYFLSTLPFFILFDCFAIGRKTAAISRVAKQSNSCHSVEQNKLMGKAAANFVCIILLTSVKWSMYGHKKSPLCHEH